MIRVFYDANAIFIDGLSRPIVAGTLTASLSGSNISVQDIHNGPPLVFQDFSQIADINGNGFSSGAICLAYLVGQFGMRRSLDVPTSNLVAGATLLLGMPAAISRGNGMLYPARADTYALALCVGLLTASVTAGFVGSTTRIPVSQPDWTAITGAQSLSVAVPYFLAPQGGMTATPPSLSAGCVCSVRVGTATDAQTFLFSPSDPVLL